MVAESTKARGPDTPSDGVLPEYGMYDAVATAAPSASRDQRPTVHLVKGTGSVWTSRTPTLFKWPIRVSMKRSWTG